MFDFFFSESNLYQNFSLQHLIPVLLFLSTTILSIWIANRFLSKNQQNIFGLLLGMIPLIALFLRMYIKWHLGEFTLQENLPLHLCRILAFFVPFMMYFRSRKMFGVLYYLIMVGTLNAIITVDLKFGYPHYGYFIYWIYHSGLILSIPYSIFVYKFKPSIKEIKTTFIALNIFFIFVFFINTLLDSNYLFVMHKPEIPTLIDYLGPWPWYILSLEMILILGSFIVYLPFAFFKKDAYN